MRRRDFITGLGGAAAWPILARAQQANTIPRIGIIDEAPIWDPFRAALQELGYIEGRTVAFEHRKTDWAPERLSAVAAELVRLRVDVIAVYGTPAARAASTATRSIPIVAISIADPVGSGLVTSFARPGGNITGNSIPGPDIAAKRIQLLQEVIPTIRRVTFLWNPNNASHIAYLDELRAVAPGLGVEMIFVSVARPEEFESAFAAMMSKQPDAFTMTSDSFHEIHAGWIIDFLARNRLPAVYQLRENVLGGGLMSYGASQSELFRRAATYVHRVLQGVSPGDLPVELPVKFELVVNLKTAKTLGLTIPLTLLARADEVIE